MITKSDTAERNSGRSSVERPDSFGRNVMKGEPLFGLIVRQNARTGADSRPFRVANWEKSMQIS